ncbi:MAG: AbrB/MazE/SpoVT family DNA-binding domain-containing protein [Spirochaetales bacterium]|nr:AbrB/MazE/SpoVT family DNA-binding domain-containing protein [Spirochaetales bacterium]
MKISIDNDGKITIPHMIQKNLGLFPGDSFTITQEAGGILLTPLKKETNNSHKSSIIVTSGVSEGKSRYFTLK